MYRDMVSVANVGCLWEEMEYPMDLRHILALGGCDVCPPVVRNVAFAKLRLAAAELAGAASSTPPSTRCDSDVCELTVTHAAAASAHLLTQMHAHAWALPVNVNACPH